MKLVHRACISSEQHKRALLCSHSGAIRRSVESYWVREYYADFIGLVLFDWFLVRDKLFTAVWNFVENGSATKFRYLFVPFDWVQKPNYCRLFAASRGSHIPLNQSKSKGSKWI